MHAVVVLAVDGVEPFDLAAACEVFSSAPVADHYSLRITSSDRRPVRTSHGYQIDPEDRAGPPGAGGTVIVPGFSGEIDGQELALLRRAHRDGARVASICTGAFALAAAGLLNGRPATTHWLFSERLAAEFPQVQVQPDVLFVDDGDILTSAGTAAGIDLCLHMVRADLGAAVANEVARRMVVAPHRDGGQAQYVKRPMPPIRGRLEATRTWALEHLAEPIEINAMAQHANLSPRHFSRIFIAETGTTPHRWLTSQRVLHARHLLEATSASVEEVAADQRIPDRRGPTRPLPTGAQDLAGRIPTKLPRLVPSERRHRPARSALKPGSSAGSQEALAGNPECSRAPAPGARPSPSARPITSARRQSSAPSASYGCATCRSSNTTQALISAIEAEEREPVKEGV